MMMRLYHGTGLHNGEQTDPISDDSDNNYGSPEIQN
jgi:hypothetical protein